jgi:fatty acid desaturase
MKFFKYKADCLPVALFAFSLALDFAVFLLVENRLFVAVWMLLNIFPKACICSFGHHHQHLPTFHQVFLNRLLEIMYGFQTGITSHAWFLHHVVGHHQHYMDQDKDESSWKTPAGRTMGTVEYGAVIAGTGYPRAYATGQDFPKHRAIFIRMLSLQLVILGCLFWYNWYNAMVLYLFPMIISLYITAWHTYYHHAGLETEDHHAASYNITHKWYNILTGNLGFHTAHHMRGGLHWSKLPELHAELEDKIPASLYRHPCWPFCWMGKATVDGISTGMAEDIIDAPHPAAT